MPIFCTAFLGPAGQRRKAASPILETENAANSRNKQQALIARLSTSAPAHGFTRPTRRARSPYRARAPPTCTLTRNNAAIAPYQRVRRVIHGRLPPKFVKVTASPAGRGSPGRFAPGL